MLSKVLLGERSLNELVGSINTIFLGDTSLLDGFRDEFVVVVEELSVHESLVPVDGSVALGGLDLEELSNSLKNTESVGDVFREESASCVENHSLSILVRNGGEDVLGVTVVGIEDSLESRSVLDRVSVVVDNSLFDGDNK